ncbi:RDD family protein [Streptomyces sp. NPDC048483]|uniref:RDD family protein n=1 Tax=Streptomyces sp. NPDC048483 TaxID=3154927 RepID=UPI0034378B52
MGGLRRTCANVIDGVLSMAGGYLGFLLAGDPRQGVFTALGVGFGFSFVNQVLLTRVVGASLGKLITRTRVILITDGGRPRLPRLFRRWLAGMLFTVYSDAVAHFQNLNRGYRPDSTGPDMPKDFCGIRLVHSGGPQAAG